MANQAETDDNDIDADTADVLDAPLPSAEGDLPPIDFSTFIVSLRASAMLHMGHGEEELNLALARQEIELLDLLEQKTRGNLTGDEERLLCQILFDLRARFLALRSDRR